MSEMDETSSEKLWNSEHRAFKMPTQVKSREVYSLLANINNPNCHCVAIDTSGLSTAQSHLSRNDTSAPEVLCKRPLTSCQGWGLIKSVNFCPSKV